MPLTKKEILAFIAGVFEGEGSISIVNLVNKSWNKRTDYALKVRISNTDRPLLDWIVDNYDGGKIHKATTVNNKIVWAWSVHAKKAELFLQMMMPYLICKKQRALLALDFRKTKDSGHKKWYRIPTVISAIRKKIYLQMKELNKKGGVALCR